MPNLLITIAKQSDLDILLWVARDNDGFLSRRSPLSIEVPDSNLEEVTCLLTAKSVTFSVKAIAPNGKLTAIAPPELAPELIEQAKISRDTTRRPQAFGERKPISEWAKDPRCKVNLNTLKSRIDQGWTMEKALAAPIQKKNGSTYKIFGETKTATEWAKDPRCKVPSRTFFSRIRLGWEPESALTTPTMRVHSSPIAAHCPVCNVTATCRETKHKPTPAYRKGGYSPPTPSIKRRMECNKCRGLFTLYFPMQSKADELKFG